MKNVSESAFAGDIDIKSPGDHYENLIGTPSVNGMGDVSFDTKSNRFDSRF